ncbi:MAG: nucleotide exchange factor GrpE [Candidatus Caenarcaniphilales bacterium]|nr:nucleotide exchange factor GrpE [Candidatus Caenarcaniphilales bacterium]
MSNNSQDATFNFEEEHLKSNSSPQSENEPRIDDLSALQEKCNSLEDQLKRSLADYQNLLRRSQNDREQMRLYGSESTLTLLIPTLDNFYYALKSFQSADPDSENLINSFRMIWTCLLKSLEEIGFKYLEPQTGEPFNPQFHDAVNKLESDLPEGAIAEIYRPGYALHDRVLKPVQVAVAMPRTTAETSQSTNN